MSLRIQIVDDHAMVRRGIRLLVDGMDGFEVCCESPDAESGYRDYLACRPDLVLLDIKMPSQSGMTLLKRLIARDPRARVMMLTMHNDLIFPRLAFEAGAIGYVTKDADPEVFMQALRAVAQGRKFIEPGLAGRIALEAKEGSDLRSLLTPREFEVFSMLARGETPRRIAEVLHLSPKTVQVHRANILRKLNVDNAVKLAHLAMRHGLLPEV
ncbi:MAG: response regulator transcription factor [Mariprofundaceae bacterium]